MEANASIRFMRDQDVGVSLRRRPTQRRSIETFDRLLDTTARLLDEVGFDGFTTNLLAARSGISVRAIYRYFPNKHSVVVTLAQRMSQAWLDAVNLIGPFDDVTIDWRQQWSSYIDGFVAAVDATPGATAVLASMRSDPELRAIDDVANRAYIEGIADALTSRSPAISNKDATTVATVLMRSTVAILDDAFVADPASAHRLVAVMKTMHTALLADYLD